MTTAIPKKTAKPSRRPVCKNCKKRFTTTSKAAVYCCTQCKNAVTNKRRPKKDPLEKALKSAFFYYIGGECLRAGTIEILRGHNLETMCELHRVYKNNMTFNGWGSHNEYELSHISPVKGHDYVGMLFAENLVSAPKTLNRAHGIKYYGFGKRIHRLTLDPKHSVDRRWNKPSEVVQMVINYLGKELVQSVIKACNIKPTQRSQLVEWILAHYDPANPRHSIALADLAQVHDLKTRELEHVKAAMLDEEMGEYIASAPTHPAIVLRDELTRLSTYRPELEVYAYALSEALATQADTRHPEYSLFSKHHEQMLFDVLHGKPIAVMADTLEMLIGENTAHAYVTYTDNDDGYYRYHPTVLASVKNPGGGAKLHRTSLAAFKASTSADAEVDTQLAFHHLQQPHGPVLGPWGHEVELPPF